MSEKKKYSSEGIFLVTWVLQDIRGPHFYTTEVPAKEILVDSGEYSDYWITKALKDRLQHRFKELIPIINWWYQDKIE